MGSLRLEHWTPKHDDRVSPSLSGGSECGLDILGTKYVEVLKLHSERPGGEFRFF
jgi:hypothetical protein